MSGEAVASMFPLDPDAEGVVEFIRSLATLKPGWDSYGAPAIEADTIERAARLVRAFRPEYRYVVMPCSDGGIAFEGEGLWEDCDMKVVP